MDYNNDSFQIPDPEAASETSPAAVEQPSAPVAKRAARSPRRSKPAEALDKKVVQRVLDKQAQIAKAESRTRDVAASLLDCVNSDTALVMAILTESFETKLLDRITELRDARTMEAAITAHGYTAAERKTLWSLLHSLSAAKGALPSDSIKAAVQIVDSIHSMTLDALDELVVVRALLSA